MNKTNIKVLNSSPHCRASSLQLQYLQAVAIITTTNTANDSDSTRESVGVTVAFTVLAARRELFKVDYAYFFIVFVMGNFCYLPSVQLFV